MKCIRCGKLIKAEKQGSCKHIGEQFCSRLCELEWKEIYKDGIMLHS